MRVWLFLGLSACGGLNFTVALDEVSEGGLWSAWGPTPKDVWVVGGEADRGVVLRGSGDDFETLPVPDDIPLLNWVHGTSAEDVWVGGLSGTLLHYDGSDWQDHSVDVDEAFWGLYAVSPTEVYAVGGSSGWGGDRRLAMRYDGEDWSDLDLPEALDDNRALFKVHRSGEEVWMVGSRGVALVGDGEAFEVVETGTTEDLSTVHSRGDGQVVMVGGSSIGVILTGSKADGLSEVAKTPARLFGVHVLGSGDVVVSGVRGYLGRFELGETEVEVVESYTEMLLHGVFGHDGETVYAVGGDLDTLSDDYTGVVLRARAR